MSQSLSETRYLLQVLASKRSQSRRRLFMTIFGGLGLAVSYGVNAVLHLLLPSTHALVLGTIVSSLIILPLLLIIGMKMWDLFVISEIKTGQHISHIRYLEEEYQKDIDRIKNLPLLSVEERAKRISEREDLFNQEREPLRRDFLKDNRFAKSTVTQSQTRFDPREGTLDALAKLK